MRLLRLVSVASVVLLAVGCSSLRVATDWDREYSFSALRTYRWALSPEPPKDAPERAFLDRRIRRAVDDVLAAKGYEKREGPADFLVVYQAKVHDRFDVYRRGPYWSRWHDVRRYREGTLVLGVVDRDRDEIVWSGWAEGIVSEPGASEEVIREAVTKILEGFPPR